MTNALKVVKTSQDPMRGNVFAIERLMTQMDQIDLRVEHHFSEGVYGRELFIPKGTTLTGKIHKHTNMNVMLKGDMSVLTEDGIKRVQAGFMCISPPGTKRVAYAHEDSVWLTIHGTDETDIEKIEHKFIAQTEQEYIEFCTERKAIEGNIKCLG